MTSTYQRRLEMPTNVFVNVTSEAQYVVMFLHLSYAKLEAANTIVWHSTPWANKPVIIKNMTNFPLKGLFSSNKIGESLKPIWKKSYPFKLLPCDFRCTSCDTSSSCFTTTQALLSICSTIAGQILSNPLWFKPLASTKNDSKRALAG